MPSSPKARQTQFKFSDPVPRPVKGCVKIFLRVGNRTDQHLLEHISFLRVLGDA